MKNILTILVLVLHFVVVIPAQTYVSGVSRVNSMGTKSAVQLSVPSGFRQIDIGSGEGVRVFRKDYAGNKKDFVTIIDLRHAIIRSLTGDVVNAPQGQVYRKRLTEFWSDAVRLETSDRKAKVVVNGTFFADRDSNGREINPTGISFGLKAGGKIISYGYGLKEYPEQIKTFAFNIPLSRSTSSSASIDTYNEGVFNRGFPDLVGALDPEVNKRKTESIPRTFLGVRDNDSDGYYETVFIFSSNAATQSSASSILSSFGASKFAIAMLDGGGSTGLIINGMSHIATSRTLPHVLAIYGETSSPPVEDIPNSSNLTGTTWRVYEMIVDKWEESEISPITFLENGSIRCADPSLKQFVWKQTGNQVQMGPKRPNDGYYTGEPRIYATIKDNRMEGSAELGQGAREFPWRAIKVQKIKSGGSSRESPESAWNSFWQAFRTAVLKRDRVALKRMMSNPFDSGGGGDYTPDKWLRVINDEIGWRGMRESVTSGTKPFPEYSRYIKRPCRVTNNRYLIFVFGTDGRWRWAAVMGD